MQCLTGQNRGAPPLLHTTRIIKPNNQPTHQQDKHLEVVRTVQGCWRAQRPLLIGTTSVNESETVLKVGGA
jgi:hypothetical protein